MQFFVNSVPVCGDTVPLGVQGENLATQITADVSGWLAQWPDGQVIVRLIDANRQSHLADTVVNDGTLVWIVTAADTAQGGYGVGVIELVQGDVVKKSEPFATRVVTDPAASGQAPEPVPGWVEETIRRMEELEASATQSAGDAQTSAQSAQAAAAQAAQSAEDAAAVLRQVETEGADQLAAIQAAGQQQTQAVTTAGAQQVSAVQTEGADQRSAIETAGTAQAAAIQAEGQTQQTAIQQKGADTLASIPSDYTELAGDVTELKSQIDQKAPAIWEDASGPIAHIEDGADDMPLRECVVQIEPVQDLHGYDNPWPAGGGKNLWPPFSDQTKSGVTLTAENGTITLNGTATEDAYFDIDVSIPVANGTTLYLYAFNPVASVTRTTLFVITTAGNPQANMNVVNASVTDVRTADRTITKLRLRAPSGETFTNFKLSPYLQIGGSAPTAFTPYSNICPISGWTGATISHSGADTTDPDEISITFPTEAGTVYGGTLDVTNGVLTVDMYLDALLKARTWTLEVINGNNVFCCNPVSLKAYNYNFICNKYKNAETYRSNLTNGEIGTYNATNGRTRFAICDNAYSTVQDFVASLDDLQVCYELATPVTYQLTPQQAIKTLLGQNNIWADTGDTSVTYPADTKLYIQQLTKPTEDDLVANAAITSGQFFMIGNRLFIATASIANGAMITPGTNATELSLADALNSLNS